MRGYSRVLVGIVPLLAGGLALSGCIKSRCFQNGDCGAGQVCDRAVGVCFEPECLADKPCPQGSFCEEYKCLEGCAADTECQPGEKCIDARCLAFREECNCLAAQDFCLADRNPESASYMKKVCVSDYKESGVALFFGSVGCPHCWHLFGQLRAMQEELAGEGTLPELVFVNIKSVDATPEKIAVGMSEVVNPIVQDGENVGFWDAYLADWYHLVLVDRSGCIAAHYGPLSSEGLDGEEGQEIRTAWKAALAAECTPPEADVKGDATGEVDGGLLPEVQGVEAVEIQGDGGSDIQSEQSPGDGLVDVSSDLELNDVWETSSDAEGTQDVPPEDVSPFQLAEVCQVVKTDPVPLGGSVPYFLCMDRNSTSSGYGLGFSPWTLSEKVWIAYFGACT